MRHLSCLQSLVAAVCCLAAVSTGVHAQPRYPDRPVRLVIPFAPGGQTDILGRRFALKMTPLLGQSMVAENRGGAGGTIGTNEVARAKPDGYTLVIGTSSTHAINPNAMENPPYDPVKDFSPVALLGTVPLALAIHPSLPARTLKELVARVRAAPGTYSYGSSGMGSINHLAGELFRKQAGGLDIVHVPYKGTGQSVQDMIGGQVPMVMATLSSVLGYQRSGRVRILAVFYDRRIKGAADIPTAIESGLPDMLAYTFNLLAAPAGTPKPVIDLLLQASLKVMADEQFQKDLETIGVEPVTDSNPDKTVKFIREELARWAPIVRATGMKVQ